MIGCGVQLSPDFGLFLFQREVVLQRLAAGENSWLSDHLEVAFRVRKIGADVVEQRGVWDNDGLFDHDQQFLGRTVIQNLAQEIIRGIEDMTGEENIEAKRHMKLAGDGSFVLHHVAGICF